MTPEQTKHIDGVGTAMHRAEHWAREADRLGLTVLAGFWREVVNILRVGLDQQARAFRDSTLLNQTTKSELEKTTGRLFTNGKPSSSQTPKQETQTHEKAKGPQTEDRERRLPFNRPGKQHND